MGRNYIEYVLLSICVVIGPTEQYNFECSAGQEKIFSRYAFDDTGITCPDLIGGFIDQYHPYFSEDCKRWIGPSHPQSVHSYYVTYCEQLDNGTLMYTADVCCDAATEMRCFECANYTSTGECMENAPTIACSSGSGSEGGSQVCQTTVEYYNNYPNTVTIRNTQCADASLCQALEDGNTDKCVDWILEPSCVYCCDSGFCNYEPPLGPPLYVGDDPCSSGPCQNGGNCVPDTPVTCTCSEEYTGQFCEIFLADPCDPNPCLGGGNCVSSGVTYECECRVGLTGDNCEISHPVCSDGDYCQNGATCYNHGTYGKRCKCTEDFLGTLCEIPKVECTFPKAYRRANSHVVLDTDCTSLYLSIKDDLQHNSGLYHCTTYMKKYGNGLFENNVHGEVNEVEAHTMDYCEKGDGYTFWRKAWCCPTCHSMPCANGAWCTQAENHNYICKCRPGWYGRNCDLQRTICLVSGDPHYRTFDGVTIRFQGGWEYELVSSTDGLVEDFMVSAANERIGKVSYLRRFNISVCDHDIVLDRDKIVTIDGVTVDPADYIDYGCFSVSLNGAFVRVQTETELVVEYDGMWTGYIQVPPTYAGQIQGLCGNFDGDTETDYVSRNGTDYVNETLRDSYVGIGWEINGNGSSVPEPDLDCSHIADLIDSVEYCGHLLDSDGLFETCMANPNVDTEAALGNCRYDVCANWNDTAKMKEAACSALFGYVVQCEAAGGAGILWREIAECPLKCDDGQVYEEVSSACPATCANPDAPSSCTLPDTEACVCPGGLLLQDGRCTAPCSCGCSDKYGNRFLTGESWLSQNCTSRYLCDMCDGCTVPKGVATEHTCEPHERCDVIKPGVGSCVVAAYMMPTTVVNGETITEETSNLTVTTHITYHVTTTLDETAPPADITVYKLVDGQPQAHLCLQQSVCSIDLGFDFDDVTAHDVYLGSETVYSDYRVKLEVPCAVEDSAGFIRVHTGVIFLSTLLSSAFKLT